MAKGTANVAAKNVTSEEPGLTPAPEGEQPVATPIDEATIEPVEADPDRSYVVMRDTGDEIEGCPLWAELGTVVASTKLLAWARAKALWPSLVPDPPSGPEDPPRTVRAKLMPQRYAGTIESTMEYVPPRAVTKGV